MKKNSTIDYYNQQGKEYAKKVKDVDVSHYLDFFVKSLPPREGQQFILEVGAGSGRDLKHLHEIGQGKFNLTALEPSKELAKIIKESTGIEAIEEFAQDLKFDKIFDGICAFASLLHIPKNELPDTLQKIRKALVDDGTFVLSVKLGEGESLDENGRFFSYYKPDEIHNLLIENGFNQMNFYMDNDFLNRNGLQWLTISVRKDLSFDLKNDERQHNFFK